MKKQLVKSLLFLVCCLLVGSPLIFASIDSPVAFSGQALTAFVPAAAVTEQSLSSQTLSERIFSQTGLTLTASKEQVTAYQRLEGVADKSTILEINSSTGTVLFDQGMGKYQTPTAAANLPVKEKANTLAEQYLKNLGLYPSDPKQMVAYKLGGIMMAAYNKNTGAKTEVQKTVTVRYSRTLAGLPVEGPGSRIIVDLGANGKLEGLVWNWHEVTEKKLASTEVYTQAQIRPMIQDRIQTFASLKSGVKAIKSTKEVLVLYDDGTGTIEPAIRVYAELVFDKGKGETFTSQSDFYVPLVKSPKAAFPAMNIPSPGSSSPQTRTR